MSGRRGTTTAALLVTGAVVLASCGGSKGDGKTPSGARASCAADSDCVVTNEGSGCCAVCPDAPRAIPVLAFEQHKNRCAAASCAPASDRIECPKVDPVVGWVAQCREGTCTAVNRGR